MPNWNGLMRNATDGLRNMRDAVVNKHDEEVYRAGFAAAATICTAVPSENIAELTAKMKSVSGLTNQEQFLLASLTEITSVTEKDLREHLDGTTTDEGSV